MRGEEKDNSRSGIGFFVILIVLIIFGVLVLKMCKPAKNKAKISQENTLSELPENVKTENPPEITKETQVSSEEFITGKIYFCRVSEDGTQKMLTAFRKISSAKSLESALTALLAGPTNAEESHDIVTNIPENTKLKSIKIDNDIAFLDFSAEFEFNSFGRDSTLLQLKQVVFTATEYSNIKKVQFLIDGEIHTYLGGDGIVIGKPLSRNDFS